VKVAPRVFVPLCRPEDDTVPPRASSRDCPGCQTPMQVTHAGKLGTLYACAQCGAVLVLPPTHPLTPDTLGPKPH
jgi:hypothetical protein